MSVRNCRRAVLGLRRLCAIRRPQLRDPPANRAPDYEKELTNRWSGPLNEQCEKASDTKFCHFGSRSAENAVLALRARRPEGRIPAESCRFLLTAPA